MSWRILWRLTEKSPEGGFIIQHVKNVFDVLDCKCPPKPVENIKGKKKADSFLEAWPADAMTMGEQKDDKDTDLWSNAKQGYETQSGKQGIHIEGKASFYEGLTEDDLKDKYGFIKDNPDTYSTGGQYSTVTLKEALPDATTNSVDHQLTTTWNCCNGKDGLSTPVAKGCGQ
jgi:hypothetical protein